MPPPVHCSFVSLWVRVCWCRWSVYARTRCYATRIHCFYFHPFIHSMKNCIWLVAIQSPHLNQNSHRGERECRGFTLSSLTLNGEWVNVLICEIYISVFFVRRRAETTSAILYNNNLIVQQQQQQQIIRVGNGGTRQRTTERITKTERKSRREREEKRKKKTYYK